MLPEAHRTDPKREAMKEASALWPKEKAKILNKIKREERRAAKETQQKTRTEAQKPISE